MKWRDLGACRVASCLGVVAVTLLAGCSAAAHPAALQVSQKGSGTPAAATSSAPAPPPVPSADPPPRPSPRPSPSALPVAPAAGRLPQTRAFPSTRTVAFRHAMDDLWLAVTSGKPRFALAAFFPVTAYVQVKAIASPATDWQHRLWDEFTLDVGAVHALLGKNAKLVRVIVPTGYAAWVNPGACYNSIGYWHVPGARVVYRQDGQLRSFGIASLISWRGVWYVVHFGAVTRSGDGGEVDNPAAGTGSPGPPGGC